MLGKTQLEKKTSPKFLSCSGLGKGWKSSRHYLCHKSPPYEKLFSPLTLSQNQPKNLVLNNILSFLPLLVSLASWHIYLVSFHVWPKPCLFLFSCVKQGICLMTTHMLAENVLQSAFHSGKKELVRLQDSICINWIAQNLKIMIRSSFIPFRLLKSTCNKIQNTV